MSSLIELIDQLARLAVAPLLFGLIGTAALLSLVRNWRVTLPTLIVQYVLVGILLARAIPPGVAIIKPFAGAIVCLALSLAAQRADNVRARRGESIARDRVESINWSSVPAQFLMRAIATVLVLTAAFGATVRFPLPGGSRELSLAAYTLLACAILLIATAPEGLNAGMGVLMLLSGIELGYTPLEASITVSVLLGLMTLVVGVAVSYLALADGGALGNIEDLLTPELAMEPAGEAAVARGDADEDDN
jgi:hypothetical protein